jgi:hypothetical protein
VKLTVKLTRVAVDGQLNVTVADAAEVGLIVPRSVGAPDITLTAPEPATSVIAVILVIVALVAAPRPELVRVKGADTVEPATARAPTLAARAGVRGVKFATTYVGPLIVTFCGSPLPVSPPEKLANW